MKGQSNISTQRTNAQPLNTELKLVPEVFDSKNAPFKSEQHFWCTVDWNFLLYDVRPMSSSSYTEIAHDIFLYSLFGITCTQVFFYFQNYESDHFIIKLSVR